MTKSKFRITWQEWIFVLLIFVFGFLFYIRQWLVFLNTLNPLLNFLIYYVIWFVIMLILSSTGFVIFGTKIKNPFQIIGTLLILFAINVILGWSNNYVYYVTNGSFTNSLNLIWGCDDGVSWWIFYDVLKIHTIWLAKLLAFSVLPALVSILGVFLVKKVNFNMWGD